MDDNQLEVEVNLDGFVYRAFVEDVKPHALEVSFENNWKPLSLIEFEKVRFPPDESAGATGFKSKQLVEVRQKDAKTKVTYWCKAILRDLNVITGRWLVEFVIPHLEIESEISMRHIRQVNEKPFIGQSTLQKVEIEIPRHLRKVAAVVGIHDDFRKETQADCCKFLSQTNILRLITRNGELTRKKVDLLKVSHINYLDGEQKRASQSDEVPKFFESFEVEANLIGLALGTKYANFQRARKIKDVTKIDFDENILCFHVCGKTKLAVKTARDMLEFREHFSSIPRYLAEELLLEDDGNVISEIVQASGLVRIECGEDDDDDTSEDYPIKFVGNPPCIENAKVLLEYQLKLMDRKLKKRQTVEKKSSIFNDPNLIVERVPIKKELRGLVVGKNYENLKKAQNIPGIAKIDAPKEMSLITIYAQNEAAARAARRLLEFDEDTVEVERSSLGKIIGKGGVTIKQIESCNEGVRVRIPHTFEASDLSSDGKVIIKVTGPAHKVPETINLIKRAEQLGRL